MIFGRFCLTKYFAVCNDYVSRGNQIFGPQIYYTSHIRKQIICMLLCPWFVGVIFFCRHTFVSYLCQCYLADFPLKIMVIRACNAGMAES